MNNISKEVGLATVYPKFSGEKNLNNPLQITIEKVKWAEGIIQYNALLKRQGKEDFFLGLVKVRYDSDENNQKIPENALYVEELYNLENDQFAQVGSCLMQAVFEKSIRMNRGGIVLKAAFNSHGFYYQKLGMRANIVAYNTIIELELEQARVEKRKPNTQHLQTIDMFLPLDSMENWKLRIHPILHKTKIIT